MEHTREERPAMHLVGIEIRASNDRGDLLGAHWGRFHGEQIHTQIPDRLDDSAVALYCEYEGDHTQPYTFFLGCQVTPGAHVPEGMAAREVPAGSYMRFDSEGEQPGALIQTWMGIHASELERSFVADYEIHDPADRSRIAIFVA